MPDLLLSRFALPTAVAALLFLALGVPALRSRLRHGEWGIVLHRRADPFQATMGAAMATLLGAVALGTGLYAAHGPTALGIWSVPAWVTAAGWLLAGAGLGLVAIAQHAMGRSWRIGIDDRPTALVERGVFALVRNPIYLGMLAMLGGVGLVAPCAWTVCVWVMTLLILSLQTRLEERHLLELHGEAYARYAAHVGRLVPGVGRLRRADGAAGACRRPLRLHSDA